MTTTSTTTGRRTAPAARAGQVLLTALLVLTGLVAVSTAFVDDPFPRPAVVLVITFGVMAVVWGVVLTWRGTTAGWALWALPLFFVVHVAALGTWIPDAPFALIAAVGVLLMQVRTPRA